MLQANGYQSLICYDTVDGIVTMPASEHQVRRRPGRPGRRHWAGRTMVTALNKATAQANSGAEAAKAARERFSQLRHVHRGRWSAARSAGPPFVIDYASHLTRNPADPGPDERAFFLACAKLSASARPGLGRRAGSDCTTPSSGWSTASATCRRG